MASAAASSSQVSRPLPETPDFDPFKLVLKKQHSILQKHSVELKKNMTLAGTYVLDYMEQFGVFSQTEVEIIKVGQRKDQVTKLLDYIKVKGVKGFDYFVDSLKDDYEYYIEKFEPYKSKTLLMSIQSEQFISARSEIEDVVSQDDDSYEDPYYLPDKAEDEYITTGFTKCPEIYLNTFEENPSYIVKKKTEAIVVNEDCISDLNIVLNHLRRKEQQNKSTLVCPVSEHLYDDLPPVKEVTLTFENTNNHQVLHKSDTTDEDNNTLSITDDHHDYTNVKPDNCLSSECEVPTSDTLKDIQRFMSPFIEETKCNLTVGSNVIMCQDLTDTLWAIAGCQKHCFVYTVANKLLLLPYSNVKRVGDPEGETWYFPIKVTSQQMERLLAQTKQKGSFYIYQTTKSSADVPYNLSVHSTYCGDVMHYHIHKNEDNELLIKYGVDSSIKFQNIQFLIDYFRLNRGRLACRLRWSPKELEKHKPNYPSTRKVSKDNLTVHYSRNLVTSSVGSDSSQIYKGCYNNKDVVVKQPFNFPLSLIEEDDFLSEARILDQIKHDNIRNLIGVCYIDELPHLVLEYGGESSLLQFVRKGNINQDAKVVLECYLQILNALMYLSDKKFIIHRDVAARNCLVHEEAENVIKVQLSDFGMAVKVVQYDEYYADDDERYSYRWASPEVLKKGKFSTKSDIWAVGLLFWELISGGKMPYENLKTNEEVAAAVIRGEMPISTPDTHSAIKKLFKQVISQCWSPDVEDRPSARRLFIQTRHVLGSICEGGPYDPLYDVHHHSLQVLPSKKTFSSSMRKKFKQIFKKNNK